MEAFVRAPLPIYQRSGRAICPKAPRRLLLRSIPVSRSLDSYREGRRFANHDSTRGQPFSERPNPSGKQTMSLLKALLKMNVASSETCELLIRSGRVRVNGKIVKDSKTRIDGFQDMLWISGTDYGTVQYGEPIEILDTELEPRSHRDFRSSIPEEGLGKKYNRRVDGGFYSRRRYFGGK